MCKAHTVVSGIQDNEVCTAANNKFLLRNLLTIPRSVFWVKGDCLSQFFYMKRTGREANPFEYFKNTAVLTIDSLNAKAICVFKPLW
ncbi:uncharacterized protein N7496_001358 [Penicillium cataractarum]|uniref:Uncharacterized protein n=1 Tax=Penicillium cataractarum TaxID=2100454 RepID=A0A9X0B6V3_9EURO|nr:uncharacterized protein N7496_001358 [Penicillium cataractarum]KAJ5390290.1 hypothetical protein N7496_001358 [Penicillium cataractarum]